MWLGVKGGIAINNLKKRLEHYPDISFIDGISFEAFLSMLLNLYQENYKKVTGKVTELSAADPIRLILYCCSVLLYQQLQNVDRAGKMGLLKYSLGDFLDNLAAMKNVIRTPAQAATCTERFHVATQLSSDVHIPKGTRVKGGDLFFATTESAKIQAGSDYVDIPIYCLTTGSKGNDFLVGEIRTLVDPINYVARVENLTKTAGGSDIENDESLAERIYLSPSAYSTAGPEDAYRYWAMTHSVAIQDCKIYTESPGEVDIYVMLQGGKLPEQDFLDDLNDFLSDKRRRPLTDKVVVKAPEKEEYSIDVTYYISKSDRDMEEAIKQRAEEACQNYIAWQQAAISRDINPSRLMYELVQAGTKWADIRSPVFTTIDGAKVASVSSVNLICGGLQDD